MQRALKRSNSPPPMALASALLWGLVELIALARIRWSRRWHRD